MLFYSLLRLDSIHRGLACYSISNHALIVSAEAWQVGMLILSRLQYPPKLGMLFCILSRLAVSSEAWHAILSYLNMPCPPKDQAERTRLRATKAQVER